MGKRIRAAGTGELALLQAVLRGEDAAWAEFMHRYHRLIRLCVRRVLLRYEARHSSQDIEDLVCDVWLQLLVNDRRKLRIFDPARGHRLSSWVGMIASNYTIDYLRRRRDESYLEDIPDLEHVPTTQPSPYSQVEQHQACMIARRALRDLKPHERQFLFDYVRQQSTPGQLAKSLGISINTVYSRRFKLQAKLAKAIARCVRPRLHATRQP